GQYIAEHKKPGMQQPDQKNNTGNGGFWIYLPDGSRYEIVFRPTQSDKKISLQILFKIGHQRPARLAALPYKDVLADTEVAAAIKPFDDAVFKYLRLGFIETGRPAGTPVHNYIDEMLAIEGSLWNSISWEVQYNINQPHAEDFEDPAIVEVIGDLILASYELKTRAAALR
ncbi:MAG: hypothetical protein K2I39_07345, partial [Muribaculaceae bacterium]|nr:hypothetical protein [Muribaculaceae bacterium]